MDKTKLLYSYTDGSTWSPYNHRRFFENGTYYIKVKDYLGNLDTETVIIDNYKVNKNIARPILTLENEDGSLANGTWSKKDITLRGIAPEEITYYVSNNYDGTGSIIAELPMVFTSSAIKYFTAVDAYGNKSSVVGIQILIDKESPSNVNTIIKTYITKIDVGIYGVDNNSGIAGYSISIDSGTNWSSIQVGKYFRFFNMTPGSYNIKVRVYDKAGNIYESPNYEIIL